MRTNTTHFDDFNSQKVIKLKKFKYRYFIVAIFLGNVSFAQEVTREVQDLVNNLAKEGYKEFRLEKGLFTQLRLIAEDQNQSLELILNPETQEVIKTRISFDDNNDGKVSRNERRQGVIFNEFPDNADKRAAAVKNARQEKKIRAENKSKAVKKDNRIKEKSDDKEIAAKEKSAKKKK